MPLKKTACHRIYTEAGGLLFLIRHDSMHGCRDSKNQRFKDSMAVDGNGCRANVHFHPVQSILPKCPPEGRQCYRQIFRNSRQGINNCADEHFILRTAWFCAWTLKINYQHGNTENTEKNVRMSQYANEPIHFHIRSFSHSHISTIMSHPFILSPMETE
jgi:hypothetical protein